MKQTTRRKWLIRLGAGVAGAVYARVLEPNSLNVTRTPVRLKGLKSKVRIAQLSDLHSSPEVSTSLLEQAAELVIQSRPDVIVLTGDYITGPDYFDAAGLVRIFRRLSEAAPTFSIQGNHDVARDNKRRFSYQPVLDLLRQGRTQVLHNDTKIIDVRDQPIAFTGTGDLWLTEFRPATAFAAKVAPEVPRILLCHNPDGKDATASYNWDLMLSGHTHGGQVVFPFMEPNWIPVVDKRFVSGLYDWNEAPGGSRQLFITRGVGSIRGLRFSCPPEIAILDLEPA